MDLILSPVLETCKMKKSKERYHKYIKWRNELISEPVPLSYEQYCKIEKTKKQLGLSKSHITTFKSHINSLLNEI